MTGKEYGNTSEQAKLDELEGLAQPAYNYSFSVWPSETWGFEKPVFELFKFLNRRVEITFTPDEFERFRSGLSHHGLTLREVERVPYAEPEYVP